MRLRKFRDFVIWLEGALIDSIGGGRESLSKVSQLISSARAGEFAMAIEDGALEGREGFEISARFRRLIEERIERLEKDADSDEAQLAVLRHGDHIRRHMRLIAVQRAEARRMRSFIESAGTRVPPPMMSL
jgi:hypothetical protein